MKKMIVIINGESGSGKDTFVEMCIDIASKYKTFFPVTNIHRSDKAKELLRNIGWDGERTPIVRELLADLVSFGEKTGHNTNSLFDSVSRIGGIIFYQSRDPKTIDKIKEHYWYQEDIQVMSVFMVRSQNAVVEFDRWDMKNYCYDRIIENNSTLENLEKEAKEFMYEVWKILEV